MKRIVWLFMGLVGLTLMIGTLTVMQSCTGDLGDTTIFVPADSSSSSVASSASSSGSGTSFDIYVDPTSDQDFKYDQSNPPTQYGGGLDQWGNATMGDDAGDYPTGGSPKSLSVAYTSSGGIFWKFRNWPSWVNAYEDFNAYTNGHVKFYCKSSVNLQVKLEANGSTRSVNISSYITPDGTWQLVSIPMTDFAGLNFSQMNAFGIHQIVNGITGTYKIDEFRLTSD